jgi:hypothetical protein
VKLANGIWKGFSDTIKEKVPGIAGLFTSTPSDASKFQGQGEKAGKKVKAGVAKALTGGPRIGLENLITDEVHSALQSARQGLSSLASGITARIDTIRQASFRVKGTGANAKEMLASQRDLDDRRYALSLAAAQEELRTSEDTVSAQLALDQLLFDRESELRQRGIDDEQAATQQSIDGLVERFNTGIINATQFQTELSALIGSNFGTDLGIGFVGAFKREFDSLIAEVKGIDLVSSIMGVPTTITPTGSSAVGALNESNTARYNAALEKYQRQKKDIERDIAAIEKNIKKQNGVPTDAQRTLLKKLRANLGNLNEPKRSSYGLALGGILKQQVFTAGEAGPEAVMPLTGRGGAILREALGMNKQGTNVYVTVNGTVTAERDLAETIRKELIRTGQRSGSIFGGYA